MSQFHKKPVTFVGEVSLNVMDLERAVQFYQEVIGFKVLEKTAQKAVLTVNGKVPMLTINQPSKVIPKEERTSGLYHFALLLPTRMDLSAFLDHLQVQRYPYGASDHDVSEALYLSDPDGNGIEVYWDRPTSEWSWSGGEVRMVVERLDETGLLSQRQAAWCELPEDTLMGHIHLHVADLKKSETFYRKGLGFDVVSRYGQAYFISTGGYHHHIGLNTWNGVGVPAPKQNSVGLHWFTLVMADEAARDRAIKQLQAIGADVNQESGQYVALDPSGNEIHLVV